MNIRLLGFFFVAFIIGLSACKKNSDAPVLTSIAGLNFINASADTVNLYLNGSRLNNNSNLYPSGSSGYVSVISGQQNYQVKKIFNPVTNTVQALFSIPLKLDSGKYYSLFIAGETQGLAFETIDTLRAIPDTIPSCYIRFVNASSDAGNLDLAIGSKVKLTNVQFKSASGFALADTGTLVPINVYPTGSATPVISGHVSLAPGRIYTFYSKGNLNGTGNSVFGLGTTINF